MFVQIHFKVECTSHAPASDKNKEQLNIVVSNYMQDYLSYLRMPLHERMLLKMLIAFFSTIATLMERSPYC